MARNYKTDTAERIDFEKLIILALSVEYPDKSRVGAQEWDNLLSEKTGLKSGTITNQRSSSGLSTILINTVHGILEDFFLKNPEHFQNQLFVLWKQHIEYRRQKLKFDFNDIPQEQTWAYKRKKLQQELSIIPSKNENADSEYRNRLKNDPISYISFTKWLIICHDGEIPPYKGEIEGNVYYSLSFFEKIDNQRIYYKLYNRNSNLYTKGIAKYDFLDGTLYLNLANSASTIEISISSVNKIFKKNVVVSCSMHLHAKKFKTLASNTIAYCSLGSSFKTMLAEFSYRYKRRMLTGKELNVYTAIYLSFVAGNRIDLVRQHSAILGEIRRKYPAQLY